MPPRPRKRAASSSIQSLVRDLVDQFDRPLDFYRELIQNAIDAGSNRIDVRLSFTPADGGGEAGQALICVEDDGEGMDEHVIDEYLLVLFRSTKEDDFTKIGKFGIGFVSVFAPRPDLVRVYTAKGGESWRLDFPSYKRYEKYRLSTTRDGTLVELHKTMTRREYDQLIEESKKTIRYWCKHSEARILFSAASTASEAALPRGSARSDASSGKPPELLSEPFELPGGVSLRHAEEGTEVALAFTNEAEPFYGFYNRGLTLKEGNRAFFPGVAVKVKSRYLEHTLTRDNVLEDENYRKLLKILDGLVRKPLAERLKGELEALSAGVAERARRGEPNDGLEEQWARRIPYLRWLFSGYLSRWRRSDWALFPGLDGRLLTLDEVKDAARAAGVLYFDEASNPVSEALAGDGKAVLAAGPWVAELASWLAVGAAQASRAMILPRVLPDQTLPGEVRGLLDTLRHLESRTGSKYRGIVAADFDYAGSCIKETLFVTQKEPGSLSPAGERPTSSLFWFGRARRYALLHAGHPFLKTLVQLHGRQPGLAGFLCLKVMHLHDGEVPPDRKAEYCNLAEKVEARLLEAALELDVNGRGAA